MTRSKSAATITGERRLAKDTSDRERPTRDEIARLAYHLYETRGRLKAATSRTGSPPNRNSRITIVEHQWIQIVRTAVALMMSLRRSGPTSGVA